MALSGIDSIKWEAARWIERRIDSEDFDEAAFNAWLADDPRHQSAFDAMIRRIMGPDAQAALSAYGPPEIPIDDVPVLLKY